MRVYAVVFLMLCYQFAVANSATLFINGDVASNTSMEITLNGVEIKDNVFYGDDFVDISISNNDIEGYRILLKGYHSSFVNSKNSSIKIDYNISCDSLNIGNSIISERLLAPFKRKGRYEVFFNIINPDTISSNVKTKCNLSFKDGNIIDPGRYFAGKYEDTIYFVMEEL